jgi:hypothetical protein
MSRLHRIARVFAVVALAGQGLFALSPATTLAASTAAKLPAGGYDFDAQTRDYAFWIATDKYIKASQKPLTYEWRSTVGRGPVTVFSKARNPNDVSFRCADIARGVVVSGRILDASGKRIESVTFAPIPLCPAETLSARPIVDYDSADGTQSVKFVDLSGEHDTGDFVSGTLTEWFIAYDATLAVDQGLATLSATYRGDGIRSTPFDPTAGIVDDPSDEYSFSAGCALFDRHLVATFEVRAADGTLVVRDEEPIPACPAGYPTEAPIIAPTASPSDAPNASSPSASPISAVAPSPSEQASGTPLTPDSDPSGSMVPGLVLLGLAAVAAYVVVVGLRARGRK